MKGLGNLNFDKTSKMLGMVGTGLVGLGLLSKFDAPPYFFGKTN
jgi:hypothetical protein